MCAGGQEEVREGGTHVFCVLVVKVQQRAPGGRGGFHLLETDFGVVPLMGLWFVWGKARVSTSGS